MCFEEADFEQHTFSEQRVRLHSNGNVIFFFKLMKTFCCHFEQFKNLLSAEQLN